MSSSTRLHIATQSDVKTCETIFNSRGVIESDLWSISLESLDTRPNPWFATALAAIKRRFSVPGDGQVILSVSCKTREYVSNLVIEQLLECAEGVSDLVGLSVGCLMSEALMLKIAERETGLRYLHMDASGYSVGEFQKWMAMLRASIHIDTLLELKITGLWYAMNGRMYDMISSCKMLSLLEIKPLSAASYMDVNEAVDTMEFLPDSVDTVEISLMSGDDGRFDGKVVKTRPNVETLIVNGNPDDFSLVKILTMLPGVRTLCTANLPSQEIMNIIGSRIFIETTRAEEHS